MNEIKEAISRDRIIQSFSELPSLPIIIQKLHGLIDDENVNVNTVANIIEVDPGFTARILKLVNSPFYGLSRQISSISEAITILGFDTVHQLLLTTALLRSFDSESKELSIKNFWRHSFAVGTIAKNLVDQHDTDLQNEIFLCGTLHDIGRLIFLKTDPELFSWFYFKRGTASGIKEETEYFGIDHQKVGEILAQKWNFPECIVMAISKHHLPLDSEKYQLHASAINIADILSHALDIGDSGNSFISEFYPKAWTNLGLNMEQLEDRLIIALDEMESQENIINDILK